MDEFRKQFANFKTKTGSHSDDDISLLETISTSAATTWSSAQDSFSLMTTSTQDQQCFGLTTFQRYIAFIGLMISSALFFVISFFSLPFILPMPGKFATSFTLGSALFMAAFMVLKGWRAHLKTIFGSDRYAFTICYIGSMIGTLYFTLISPSYVAVVIFILLQIVTMAWYVGSYLPGGTNGLKWMTRSILPL